MRVLNGCIAKKLTSAMQASYCDRGYSSVVCFFRRVRHARAPR